MPLLLPTLYDPMLKLFTECSSDRSKSAEIMAKAYVDYVSTAVFGPSLPLFTGLELAILKATIYAVLDPSLMNPAGLGNAYSTGLKAFWTAPPIVCVGAAPGTVTQIPGADSLVGQLTAICSVPGQPAQIAALRMATAIDTATKTTMATLTVSGTPTPTPIA